MQEKQPKKLKPPKLLAGFLSAVLGVTAIILLTAWVIINYQVEALVAKRSSEYANSIIKIVADSSADALLSDDKIQLQMLTKNVAQNAYINNAIIYAEDGQVVAEFPETIKATPEENNTEGLTAKNSEGKDSETEDIELENSEGKVQPNLTYQQSQNNIPFIEKISYQGVTAGWFKINLNKQLLEKEFKASLERSQRLVIVISVLLSLILLVIGFYFEKSLRKISQYINRLILLNAEQLPKNKKQWFATLKELSETRFQAFEQAPLTSQNNSLWLASKTKENIYFCFCEFSMQDQNHEKAAGNITKAQDFLQKTAQAHSAHFEGNILSGCQIAFLNCKDEDEALVEAITLTHVLSELLSQLDLEITMQAFIGKGSMLVLENERGFVSGISLSNKQHRQIAKTSPLCNPKDIIYLGLEQALLASYVDTVPIEQDKEKSLTFSAFRLVSVKETIKQQSNRQINYIAKNFDVSK